MWPAAPMFGGLRCARLHQDVQARFHRGAPTLSSAAQLSSVPPLCGCTLVAQHLIDTHGACMSCVGAWYELCWGVASFGTHAGCDAACLLLLAHCSLAARSCARVRDQRLPPALLFQVASNLKHFLGWFETLPPSIFNQAGHNAF